MFRVGVGGKKEPKLKTFLNDCILLEASYVFVPPCFSSFLALLLGLEEIPRSLCPCPL